MAVILPTGNPTYQAGVMNGTMQVANGQTASVLNPVSNGFQVSQVIAGPASPTTYLYQMNLPAGYFLAQPLANGFIPITTDPSAPSASNSIGFVDPPSAVDAKHAAVQTQYVVDFWGSVNTILQITTPSASTAFPVVADPEITFGNGVYIYFSHTDASRILYIWAYVGIWAVIGLGCYFFGDFFGSICAILILGIAAWVHYTMSACYSRNSVTGVVYHLAVWGNFWDNTICVASWS
jgi:hypothetical protein